MADFDEFLADMPDPPPVIPRGDCENPYCLDGYVDQAFSNQDGTENWVDQVPCQVCNGDDEDHNHEPQR